MRITGFEHIDGVIGGVIATWPEHEKYLTRCFSGYDVGDLTELEELARCVVMLMGDNAVEYYDSYRWMCGEINKETLYFKRNGRYRLSTFEEANREVYSNRPFMKKYIEGILTSQMLWRNHSAAFLFFKRNFLASLKPDYRYLEVGPGHGLFLSVAAQDPRCGAATAWDVSEESLRQTREALDRFGVGKSVLLERQDIHAPTRRPEDGALFDGIALCEVLEHLEHPREALASLGQFLSPDGVLYINVPLNSPAPDHIFLLRNEAEVRSLMESAGLSVVDLQLVPMTGYDLKAAQSQNATVTCFVLARRA